MPPPIFPSGKTSYIELFLMALMGLNHLLDDAPHHLLYSKREKERARQGSLHQQSLHSPLRQRYPAQPLGFVTEIPDHDDRDGRYGEGYGEGYGGGYQGSSAPPVLVSGKEAYPFARVFYDEGGRRKERREREREVSDAWVKMRGVRGTEGRRGEGRGDGHREGSGKRVRFEREVRWWVFDGEEGG